MTDAEWRATRRTTPRAPGGCLRRLIVLRRQDVHTAYGWVEDDFHHFGVTLGHADGVITRVSATAKRAPWTTCAAAAFALSGLEGQALRPRASEIGAMIDMRLQCTHMFDLAGLVMAHAFHGRDARTYEVEVSDRAPDFAQPGGGRLGRARARLSRDSRPVMAWDLDGDDIVGPEPYGGHYLNEGFRAWTETLPEDEAEQATVLRRTIMVSNGRFVDLDRVRAAADAPQPPVCHTFRGDLHAARRVVGSTRDYAAAAEGMLAYRDEIP